MSLKVSFTSQCEKLRRRKWEDFLIIFTLHVCTSPLRNPQKTVSHLIWLSPWSTLVEWDEQPYWPHGQATKSMKVKKLFQLWVDYFLSCLPRGWYSCSSPATKVLHVRMVFICSLKPLILWANPTLSPSDFYWGSLWSRTQNPSNGRHNKSWCTFIIIIGGFVLGCRRTLSCIQLFAIFWQEAWAKAKAKSSKIKQIGAMPILPNDILPNGTSTNNILTNENNINNVSPGKVSPIVILQKVLVLKWEQSPQLYGSYFWA